MSGETRPPEPSSQTVELERIDSAPFQIRESIDEERLRELAISMQRSGLLHPILIRRKGDRFEVVVGERRFRAAKLLQWSAIPCRVAELSDLDAEIDKVVENEQRVDAAPHERARAFAHLRDAFNLDQTEIARRTGVHKSVVSRMLALLEQPAEIQKLVSDKKITTTHLRSLEAIEDESKRVELAAQVANERLSTRQMQRRVREAAKSGSAASSEASIASAPAEMPKHAAEERSSASPLGAADLIAKAPAQTEQQQAPNFEEWLAKWIIPERPAVGSPWRDAVRGFYQRMTDAALWRRVLKRVLKFLARFIPGREPEPSALSKAIKAAFHPELEPTNSESSKPDANPSNAAQGFQQPSR